jgi:hypothetical protein
MRSALKQCSVIVIGVVAAITSVVSPALAELPLQVGVYRLGSKYIQIAQTGSRMCFRGFSIHGATTASISPDRENPGFYLINGFDDTVFHQSEINTILFGSRNQLVSYSADYEFPRDLGEDLQRCLKSQQPFFERVSGGRGE